MRRRGAFSYFRETLERLGAKREAAHRSWEAGLAVHLPAEGLPAGVGDEGR